MAFSEFWFGRRAHFYYSCFEDFDSFRHVQIFLLHPARLTLGFLSGRLFIPTFSPTRLSRIQSAVRRSPLDFQPRPRHVDSAEEVAMHWTRGSKASRDKVHRTQTPWGVGGSMGGLDYQRPTHRPATEEVIRMDAEEPGMNQRGWISWAHPSTLIGFVTTGPIQPRVVWKKVHWACQTRVLTSSTVSRKQQQGTEQIAASCSCERKDVFTIIFLCQKGRETGKGTGKDTTCLGRKPNTTTTRGVLGLLCVNTRTALGGVIHSEWVHRIGSATVSLQGEVSDGAYCDGYFDNHHMEIRRKSLLTRD